MYMYSVPVIYKGLLLEIKITAVVLFGKNYVDPKSNIVLFHLANAFILKRQFMRTPH